MKNYILLRYLEAKDAPFMYEWMSDPEMTQNFRFDVSDLSLDSVHTFIEESQDRNNNVHFAIVDCERDEYLGTISLKNIDYSSQNAEYAISLRKKACGKGYGREATVLLLEYAFFTLGLERIYLNVLSDNKRAVNFYQNFGFVYEGEFLDHLRVRNQKHSLKWFRLMKEEYIKMRE